MNNKRVVLTRSDLNSVGKTKQLLDVNLNDFLNPTSDFYNAEDVVFLSDGNTVQPIKSRTVQYSGAEERKNYEWYREKNQDPKILQPNQSDFLGNILRLHRDEVIKLSYSEYHMVVMTLYRDWYNTGNGQKQLNRLRIKYKQYLK